VIGHIGDNGEGVAGVQKNPDLFSFHIGKGLSDAGSGATSNILKAVSSCVDQGAKVISMSLGGPSYSEIEELAYKMVYDQDILVIAAAGNAGNTNHSFPTSYPSVVSVAAIDSKERWVDFSQCNDQVKLAGPGVNVLSTYIGNTYETLSGTSMTCPHVAGLAAARPNCRSTQAYA
jgi:serine protease